MARTTFHQVAIGGLDFEARLSVDGPYLSATRDGCHAGGSPLGHATRVTEFGFRDASRAGPWVSKDGAEPRIFLGGFGLADLDALRTEFGIGGFLDDVVPFQETRAWAGLVIFVRSRPKIAARNGRYETYLKGWHDAARLQAGLRPVTSGHRRAA